MKKAIVHGTEEGLKNMVRLSEAAEKKRGNKFSTLREREREIGA
jgi:hypothetical protein